MNIAIIMDGNGRWAEQQGMLRVKGHERGAEVVREITTWCSSEPEIKSLTLYAFSTENWKRPKLEVEFLMKLLKRYLKNELSVYLENNVRFHAIGDITRFDKSLQNLISDMEEKTAHCDGLIQHLALNYGSQDELTRAVNSIKDEEITAESLQNALDMKENIDILIRTGGDNRLSNFMLWQAAYAEFFFIKTLWPNFSSFELEDIIEKFKNIDRRFGGLN